MMKQKNNTFEKLLMHAWFLESKSEPNGFFFYENISQKVLPTWTPLKKKKRFSQHASNDLIWLLTE